MTAIRETMPLNWLRLYRKQNGLSQREVARLMGLRSSAPISRYERGTKVPSLSNALKLEIIYHTPAAFLFQGLYQRLRGEIRASEEGLSAGRTKR